MSRLLKFLTVLCLLAIGPASANFSMVQFSSVPTTVFTHVQIGGAGATVGVASVPSLNLLLSRQDQFGCYKSVSNAQWTQLITTAAMPALSVTNSDGGAVLGGVGCDMVAGDASGNIWLSYNGSVYVSANSGASFSATCYPAQTATANVSTIKAFDPKIAIDPSNVNVVYLSTPGGSLQRTVNKGSSCSGVGTLATPSASGGYLITFDTSAGTTASCAGGVGVCTKNVYVSVYGTGVYKSTDGGQTWALTTGTPTTHVYMVADPTGVLWLVDNSGGNGLGTARKFNGSTWSAPSFTNNTILFAVAADALNCTLTSNCHVAFIIGGGKGWAYSADGGGTWNATSSVSVVASDVPWLANQLSGIGFFGSGAVFDSSGHIYIGEEGVFFTTPATSGTVATWTSQTTGIEEFETNQIVSSQSGSLVAAGWDIGCFALTAPFSTMPSNAQHGCKTPNQANLQHGYSIDYDASTPANFVSLVDSQGGYGGGGSYISYAAPSTDGGSTWGTLFTVPATISSGGLKGGCIVSAPGGAFMWAPTDGSGGSVAPFHFPSSGGTGTQLSVAGATGGWPFQYYLSNHQCAADRVTADTFYFYNFNRGTGSPSDAFYKCTGTSCTLQSSPGFGANNQFNPTLKAVPGNAGYLFVAYGTVQPAQDITGNGFYYSTDGLVTVNTIANITGVSAFGFGKAFAGHTFPAIYFAGWNNHVYGIWRSIDWDGAKTWQQIGTYPLNIPLAVWDIDGDKQTAGVFYLGTVSGVFCGSLSISNCNGSTFLLKRDLNPANDNTPMWLNKAA